MSTTVSNAPLSNYEVAAEVIGGQQYQFIKLIDGTPGSTTPVGTAGNPVNVAGSFSASVATAPAAAEGVVTVDSTAGGTEVLAANGSRKDGQIRVSLNATAGVYIARGATADATSRYYAPGDTISLASGAAIYTGPITAFVPSGSQPVEYTEL